MIISILSVMIIRRNQHGGGDILILGQQIFLNSQQFLSLRWTLKAITYLEFSENVLKRWSSCSLMKWWINNLACLYVILLYLKFKYGKGKVNHDSKYHIHVYVSNYESNTMNSDYRKYQNLKKIEIEWKSLANRSAGW